MTYISRDPFAREELHRVIVERYGNCDWCGNVRYRKGKPILADSMFPGKLARLFVYITETDGGSRHEHRGQFCSKSCHDIYHT